MKKTLRNILLAGGITLASLFPMKTDAKIKGSISSKISNSFIPPMVGAVLGKGPHQQNSFNLDLGKFSLYTWSSTDLGGNLGKGKEANEFDVGVSYSTDIKKTKNSALSLRTGFEHWTYTGGYDNILFAGLNYQGPINVGLTLYQAIGHDEVPTANSFLANISKSFPIGKRVSITPKISAAYMNNFYGNKGLAHTTIGTEFNYKTGPVNISASLKQQLGFMKENPKIRNKTSLDIGVNFDF